MIKFPMLIFFYIFVHRSYFARYLCKFQFITNMRTHVFGILFPRVYGRHNFFLSQVLVEIGEYDVIFSKNTTRVEILLTISTAIHIRIAKTLAHIL